MIKQAIKKHITQIKNHEACKMTQIIKNRMLLEMNNHNGKLLDGVFSWIRISAYF